MTSKIDTLISQGTYGMGEDRLKKLMGETLRVELSRVHPVPPVPPTPGPVLPGNDEEQADPNAVAQGGITMFMWADTDSKAKKTPCCPISEATKGLKNSEEHWSHSLLQNLSCTTLCWLSGNYGWFSLRCVSAH